MSELKFTKHLPDERLLFDARRDANGKCERLSTGDLDLMLPRQMAEVQKLRKMVQLKEKI